MSGAPLGQCSTAHLFRPLLEELLALLRGLDNADWQRQTVAPGWRVRDVAAHLVDVDLRRLAAGRDGHFAPVDKPPSTEREITDLVNALNASGVHYGTRLSPRLLIDLLDVVGRWVAGFMESLPPNGKAVFGVSWAGESESEHWMDIGREYTERWHHQMQIRDATSRPLSLLEPRWMLPLLDMSVRALPHAYRGIQAPAGTAMIIVVDGETSGAWTLVRRERDWQIISGAASSAQAVVRLSADNVWRMLYNAPYDRAAVRIDGDAALAAPLFTTRSVIV